MLVVFCSSQTNMRNALRMVSNELALRIQEKMNQPLSTINDIFLSTKNKNQLFDKSLSEVYLSNIKLLK